MMRSYAASKAVVNAVRWALLISLISAGNLAADGSSSLIGRWSFEQTQGRLALDSGAAANHAIVVNGTLVSGVDGVGLQFDGRATTANCPHTPLLSPAQGVTIEAWFLLRELPGSDFPSIVRKEDAFALRFSGERLGFLIWMNGGMESMALPKTDWSVDQWYHLVATYDGQQMRMYLDGQEGATAHAASGEIDASSSPLGIGCSGSQHLFCGVIDEVSVYGQALSAKEIEARHEQGRIALVRQTKTAIKPKRIGQRSADFRKPPREIGETVEGYLWIDAEDFTDYGGWLLDTQFAHLMGSAYLIASGVGRPVDDAVVDVAIPRPGTWRLWVRSRNWMPEYSPGSFALRVGERISTTDFGVAESDAWVWQAGGDFQLKAGQTRLALHDLTGYYGRCDAIVLTTDPDYQPPNDLAALRQERSRLTGLSLEPRLAGDFDVVVVGAGSAGGPAALAAARLGAKTALIQNRPVLGGNASIELGVPICGASVAHRNARESGIIEELGRIRARYAYPKMSEPMRLAAEAEPNLTVFTNEHVDAVTMRDDRHIASVQSTNTLTGEVSVYRSQLFLDCTGDGWVGYFAGAEYRLGREASSEFDEDLAPETPDRITMSGCLMGQRSLSYRAASTGKPVAYEPPPWAAKLPPAEHFGRRIDGFVSGNWWLEHPGTVDDLWDAEHARDELIRITYGYWDFIKNHWQEKQRAAKYQLAYVPITDAKRESRRLVGDYILTQNDVLSGRVFSDRISYGGWSLDVHHPEGVFSGDEGPFDFDPRVPIYTIPYRCLYSRNIENLLFAGRCASVSHVALGTVRVQGTLATLGQAAGTAAALCVEGQWTPRQLGQQHIDRLQQTLLKHDQYIPQLTNQDPADLVRTATIRAASTAQFDPFSRSDVVRADETHPLNTPRAVMLPRGLKQDWRAVSLLLSSEANRPVEVTLHMRGARAAEDFTTTSGEHDLATVTATVPPGRESWVTFPLNSPIESPYVWFWLSPAEGVSWRLMVRAPTEACRAYGGGATRPWTVVSGQFYAIATDPPLAIPTDYAPQNIANGVTRIVGQATNLWASDPDQSLPQSIDIEFAGPRELNTVYLTFDTEMNNRYHNLPLVPQCVRDYEISSFDGQDWIVLVRESGNFQRHRVHRFDTVRSTRLRLTVLATNGSPSARVFEIRAYRED